METKKEQGITLIALIITVILLVILSAVAISTVYNSRIVEIAIKGAKDYTQEGINENYVLDETGSIIDSVMNDLGGKTGGNGSGEKPETGGGKQGPFTADDLNQDDMIGKYVSYVPDGTNYSVDGNYSGTGSSQTFEKNVGEDGSTMKWRIFDVNTENNKLLLISEQLAKSNITLKGANGYNNAVKILNDACAQAFGTETYGTEITVRSINQEDIDAVTGMKDDSARTSASASPSYGTTCVPTYWKTCPSIYASESGNTGGGSLERSSQSGWKTGTTKYTSVTCTRYGCLISSKATHPMYYALLTNMENPSSGDGYKTHTSYWVASRCVDFNSESGFFDMFCVKEGYVSADTLYGFSAAAGTERSKTYAVRPVVEVDLDLVAIGADETTDGTAEKPYSMESKQS